MKRKKRTGNGMMILLAAGTLLTGTICAEMTEMSDVTSLDTRSLSQVVAVDNKPLDSRSYTADWSAAGRLNTKRIMGTMIRVR